MNLPPADEMEFVEEVAQHLEDQFAELAVVCGATAARERLLQQLRDHAFDEAVERRRQRTPPIRSRTWHSTGLLRDVRFGLRALLRNPGTIVAGTTALALGIGLTAMMFSIIYGVLLKGLPFNEPDRIAFVYYADPEHPEDGTMPLGDFARYRAQQRSFESLGGYAFSAATVSGGDAAERVDAARLTGEVFDVAGVRPLLGRTLTASDNAADALPVVVLGYAVWRDRYALDSGVLGRNMRINGRQHVIVGVMPDGFSFPNSQKLWLPLQVPVATLHPGEGPELLVVGRLRAGVSYERAITEFRTLARPLLEERKPLATEWRTVVKPFIRGFVPPRLYSLMYAMLGAVFLVLLVACANVTNLLLDRAANRTREIAIRTALGASRLAVVRQSLVESAILAALAAVAGTALAQLGIVVFNRSLVDMDTPFWMDVRLHPAVLLFVLAMTVVATFVSGILPAIQSARLDVNGLLKDQAQTTSSLRAGRLSRGIVVAEIALSSSLLLAAGFLATSIVKLRNVRPGFAEAGVVTARVSSPPADTAAQRQFFETLERELAARPEISAVYLGSGLPGTGWHGDHVAIDGHVYPRDQDRPFVRALSVTPGFFSTFAVRMLRGRAIAMSDRQGSTRVAVVSESFVERHFPGLQPVGQRIRLGASGNEGEWLTIVGVMPSLFSASFQNPFPAEVLTAFWQDRQWAAASIAVRGAGGVALHTVLRQTVGRISTDAPVYASAPMQEVIDRQMWAPNVFSTIFIIFGVVALLLAVIGLYAVMTFSVSRRVREMGIRMALGATGADVILLVCRQGAMQIMLGMAIGLPAGAGIVRLARAALFEVQPNDPAIFSIIAGVLGSTALLACLIPAVGATQVDPVQALRVD